MSGPLPPCTSPATVREILAFVATRPDTTALTMMAELWGREETKAAAGYSRGVHRVLDTLVGFGVLVAGEIEIDGELVRTYALHADFPKAAIRKAIEHDATVWSEIIVVRSVESFVHPAWPPPVHEGTQETIGAIVPSRACGAATGPVTINPNNVTCARCIALRST